VPKRENVDGLWLWLRIRLRLRLWLRHGRRAARAAVDAGAASAALVRPACLRLVDLAALVDLFDLFDLVELLGRGVDVAPAMHLAPHRVVQLGRDRVATGLAEGALESRYRAVAVHAV